jgi:hypothetical protein
LPIKGCSTVDKKIIVVKTEIESWILTGISTKLLEKFNIKSLPNTDRITKEDFRKMLPRNVNSIHLKNRNS